MFNRILIAYIGFWYRIGLFRWKRLRTFREWLDRRLIERQGWFDDQTYLTLNPDVQGFDGPPIQHFVRFGRSERRRFNVVFDNEYYRSCIPLSERHILPLVHYILFGHRRSVSPSPWFDISYYVKQYSTHGLMPETAFPHYFTKGHRDNLRPSVGFNPERYLRGHPEAMSAGIPAIVHFLTHEGSAETAVSGALQGLPLPRVTATDEQPVDIVAKIHELPVARPAAPMVDVVVPVYGAREETLSCLYHVLVSQNKAPFRLIVVDDKSPDQDLSAILRSLADSGYIELIYHSENIGFVGSVNDGMSFDGNTDVILLNSDTEVYGNWIDRLKDVAESNQNISTVTPLTNNGTICGYPFAPSDNPKPLELPFKELDRLAWEVNGLDYVPLPTAIGFCMYIKREALRQLGLFDLEAFGRGYGEENDFCLRGQVAGWIDVAAPGVFVRHLGSLSFTGEKAERVANALEVVNRRYPQYERQVQEFLRDDPLRPFRAKLDLARLKAVAEERNVLVINHTRGGGTEQYVRDMTARSEAAGKGVFRLVPAADGAGKVRLFHQDLPEIPNLPDYSLVVDQNELAKILAELRIGEMQVHHTVDFGPGAARQLAALASLMGIPVSVMVHDYYSICPRINLMDENGFYCREPGEEGCNACLKQRGSEAGQPDILAWRAGFRELLTTAAEVAAPSGDTARRLRRYFPGIRPIVRPHESKLTAAPMKMGRGVNPLRIGVIGAISSIKGFRVLVNCAIVAKQLNVPVEFVVVGYTEDNPKAESVGIEITGPYRQSEIMDEIKEEAYPFASGAINIL